MIITLVVAASENNVIGKDNDLPWRLPSDLKFFKQVTTGKPIIMGRKTWDSMGGKALPNRLNIVLSSQHMLLPEGVLHVTSIDAALEAARAQGAAEACIIGGGQLFATVIHTADQLYLTRVHTTIEDGSAFFPPVDEKKWKLEWHEDHEADEKNQYAFTFNRYQRT